MEQKRSRTNMLVNILIVVCIAGMLFAAVKLLLPLLEYRAGDALYLELSQSAVATPGRAPVSTAASEEAAIPTPMPMLQLDYKALQTENNEFYTWLYSSGTVINYPVVQGGNNSYYLNHLFNKERNSMGTLFVDAGNAPDFLDQNTIIYGHHMKNGSMLASLVNYKEQTYYNVHPELLLSTPSGAYKLELFAAYITDGYVTNDVYKKSFDTEAEFLSFIEHAQAASDFMSDVEVTAEDHIVTLSTCTYEYDEARYVVIGKLVRIQ